MRTLSSLAAHDFTMRCSVSVLRTCDATTRSLRSVTLRSARWRFSFSDKALACICEKSRFSVRCSNNSQFLYYELLEHLTLNRLFSHMHAKALSENENRHLAERHVTLRNDLVAASHGLKTLTEQRIVKSCAAKLDSVRIDQGRYKIKLTATEYAETFNL